MKKQKRVLKFISILSLSIILNSGFIISSWGNFYVNSTYFVVQQDDEDAQWAKYEEHVKKGNAYFDKKNYSDAMVQYQQANELFPDEEEPKLRMQLIETSLGIAEYEKLVKEVEQKRKGISQPTPKKQTVVEKEPVEVTPKDPETAKRDSIRKAILAKHADSIQVAQNTKDPIRKSLIYTAVAEDFNEVEDNDMALEYFQKALVVEEEIGTVDIAHIYDGMAVAHFNSGNIDNTINSYEKSMEVYEKAGDNKGKSEALNNIGNVYEKTFDYDRAVDYYEKTIEIKSDIDDKEGLTKAIEDVGNVYFKKKDLEKSIESYTKSAEITEKLQNQEDLGDLYNKLGVAHYELGNLGEAESYFTRSIDLLKSTDRAEEASMALNNVGNVFYNKANFEEAVKYYSEALKLKDSINHPYGKAVTLFNLGNSYRRMGWEDIAMEYYQKSKELAIQNDLKQIAGKSYKAIAKVHEMKGELGKAEEIKALSAEKYGTNFTIEIPISENSMDLDIEETKKVISFLTEEAVKKKELFDSQADNQVKDLMIATLQEQVVEVQNKANRNLIIGLVVIGILLISNILLIVKRKK